MSASKPKTMTLESNERQRAYVDAQKERGQGLGVVFADAFLRGMRDLGYKNPAWALAEQLDNAFQAGANTVAVRLAIKAKRPEQIAICDNGAGMIPEMIGYAVRWGGTDREGDRNGFGRYGYGLPSSAVSIAKRYTVYSKASGGQWHAVTVDIEELAAAASDIPRTEALLTARPATLPPWLAKAAHGDDKLDVGALESGTVVVLEHLDRLAGMTGWIKPETLRTKLLQHFGVIYRHWVPERRVVVDGVVADAVDPLFLMEHGRFFDETPVRAQRIEARTFEVTTSRGTTGKVTIRAALLPPNFQQVDPAQFGVDGERGKMNKRHDIMKVYNGLLVCRERRQIDCIAPRWTSFQTYDRNIKIEIDFDPELDEYFGITTSKQQIEIDDQMWEKLQHKGQGGGALVDLVEDMRRKREALRTQLAAAAKNRPTAEAPRASAAAMETSEQYKGSTPEPTPAQRADADKNVDEAAAARAARTGESEEKAREAVLEHTAKRRWEVEFAAIPEGPFYRPIRLGEQKRVVINTEHPFYARIYSAVPEASAALEVLLFVLAERELEVNREAETFYRAERGRWSERLRQALNTLLSDQSLADRAAAVAEQMHMSSEPDPPAA